MTLEHTPFETDNRRLMNLLTLAYYLKSLPKNYSEFSMQVFCREKDDSDWQTTVTPVEAPNRCGTVACAVGHGPTVGIKPKADEDWFDYSERCFIGDSHGNEWEWCFSGGWAGTDNTPQGAGDRILYLVDKGLPENWEEQLGGDAPLSYKRSRK